MVVNFYYIYNVNVVGYIHQYDAHFGQMCEQNEHFSFGSMSGIVSCGSVWFLFRTVCKYMQWLRHYHYDDVHQHHLNEYDFYTTSMRKQTQQIVIVEMSDCFGTGFVWAGAWPMREHVQWV